jgi:glycosyltransferase involved in cell wall biosynthesis
MSCIYKGNVIETTLSLNAHGGTELMRERLLSVLDKSLLQNFAIHLSRPRELYKDVKNIFWAHDLAEDPENKILNNFEFDAYVFVSNWQRNSYLKLFPFINIYKTFVIENAVSFKPIKKKQVKDNDIIQFIYHTTPHRGLELLYPIFDALTKKHDNIHLNVYSSFNIYGWPERDNKYDGLFNKLSSHDKITYHKSVSNDIILKELSKSHIFLYPCIWKETSCLAMIEAIRSGLVCIHPNFGALAETSQNKTLSFDFDTNTLMNDCYIMSDYAIRNYNDLNILGDNNINDIKDFKNKWTKTLKHLM